MLESVKAYLINEEISFDVKEYYKKLNNRISITESIDDSEYQHYLELKQKYESQ